MDWKNKPNQIFNKVKQQMYSKGVESFHWVDQFTSQFDQNNTQTLTSHFFNLYLNKVGVFLSTQEIRNIRDLYSKNKDQDAILYQVFFEDVKYSISQKIAALINQAYQTVNKHHQETIHSKALIDGYNVQGHPHALTRRKSNQDIHAQFVSAISRKVDNQGRVSYKAFVDYYAQLNFCIPNQRQSQLIIGTWNLQHPDQYVSLKRLTQLQHTLYQKIRLKSDGKTNQWKTGKKALSYFDLYDQKLSNYDNFKRGMDKFGCVFKQHEMRAIYNKYANNGVLDYQDFVKQIMDIDINGMIKQTNLFQTKMGTNHFTVKH